MNTLESFNFLFQRDLDRLATEINSYSDESDMWILKDGINNTAGNLALHLNGNLQHFVGAVLGKTGYVRKRDLEFSDKNVPRADLLKGVEDTKKAIEHTLLSVLSEADLESIYPEEIWPKKWSVHQFLMHLNGHLNYHLGQVNYHRRILG